MLMDCLAVSLLQGLLPALDSTLAVRPPSHRQCSLQ